MSDIDDLKAFLGLDAEHVAAVRSVLANLETAIPEVLEQFYRHISSIPETAAFFQNADVVEHAKMQQIQHWRRLFSCNFDDEYINSVRKIGLTHARIGLEPKWYLAGYAFIMPKILEVGLRGTKKWRLRRGISRWLVTDGLIKVIMLDIDLALSVYHQQARSAHAEDLARLSVSLRGSVIGIVGQLNSSAKNLEEEAVDLVGAAEKGVETSVSVVETCRQNTAEVQSAAAAVEELAASVGEITAAIARQGQVTDEARCRTDVIQDKMRDLGNAAADIDRVLTIIDNIARQTTMLAMNATIEAARAADAGSGFAVVAREVKKLAERTSEATADIARTVQSVRSHMDATGLSLTEFIISFNEMHENAAAIAAAVEEQSAATEEISRSLALVAQRTQAVGDSVSGIGAVVHHTKDSCSATYMAVGDMRSQTQNLEYSVAVFLEQLQTGAA